MFGYTTQSVSELVLDLVLNCHLPFFSFSRGAKPAEEGERGRGKRRRREDEGRGERMGREKGEEGEGGGG